MTTGTILDMDEYMAKQREEIRSAENHHSAKLSLGHDPSPHEAAMHYITGGGSDNFARRHRVQAM